MSAKKLERLLAGAAIRPAVNQASHACPALPPPCTPLAVACFPFVHMRPVLAATHLACNSPQQAWFAACWQLG